jgi:rod shape-determining protein MreD
MRLVLVLLMVLVLQGVFGALVPPGFVSDLFLLAAIGLSARVGPVRGVAAGFVIGLVQDLAGFGAMGVHALGVAAGVFTALLTRGLISGGQKGYEVMLAVGGQIGKWLALILMLAWTQAPMSTGRALLEIALPETIVTALLAPLVAAAFSWAMGRETPMEEGLL